MSDEEWEEDLLDPDIYSVALDRARKITIHMRKAWEYLIPIYNKLEDFLRINVSKLSNPSKEYEVIAIDSTFSPTLSLRGLRAGFILLAAITYPKAERPIFRLRSIRGEFSEEEESYSYLSSVIAKREELKLMEDIISRRDKYHREPRFFIIAKYKLRNLPPHTTCASTNHQNMAVPLGV